MGGTFSQQLMENSASNHLRILKQKLKNVQSVDPLDVFRQSFRRNDNITIDNLSDDILIAILSRMSLRDAVRTSVLSCRWRYLWMSKAGTLDFHDRDVATGTVMEREDFISLVTHVLDLHRGDRQVDGLIIRLGFDDCHTTEADTVDFNEWVYFFIENELKRFELNFSNCVGYHCCYKFPSVENLLLRKVDESSLVALRSLKLVDVDVEDEVVHFFLAECPFIEHLCLSASAATRNLEIVDPLPNLKELEISDCWNIKSLEISAANLVSFTYQGPEISPPVLRRTPNLSVLTLGKEFCMSFIREPNEHSSYSVQLVKLVLNFQDVRTRRHDDERNVVVPADLPQLYGLKRLELNIVSQVGRSLLFFTSLIKASPLLQEFKLKVAYVERWFGYSTSNVRVTVPFPEVSSVKFSEFDHKNLKVVEMVGYYGCVSEERFLVQLSRIAPSLETVVIDTDCVYDGDCLGTDVYRPRQEGDKPMKNGMMMSKTRILAKQHADRLTSRFRPETKFVIT